MTQCYQQPQLTVPLSTHDTLLYNTMSHNTAMDMIDYGSTAPSKFKLGIN